MGILTFCKITFIQRDTFQAVKFSIVSILLTVLFDTKQGVVLFITMKPDVSVHL